MVSRIPSSLKGCGFSTKELIVVSMLGLASGRRLAEVEKRLEEMEVAHGRVVELEADWQDWLHKIRNVLARLNQRTRDHPDESPAPRRPINPAAAKLLGFNSEDVR